MDNVSFHKNKKTKELIEKAGCKLLFLPPYSPALNPIEKYWANLKYFIKSKIEKYENLEITIKAYMEKKLNEVHLA